MIKVFVNKKWVKYLGIALVLYSTFAGLLVPLAPGIAELKSSEISGPGSIEIGIEGYNTHFSEEIPIKSWLRRGSLYLCANRVEVIDEQNLVINFEVVPAFLIDTIKDYTSDLILNSERDGNIAYRNGLIVKQLIPNTLIDGELPDCQRKIKNRTASGVNFPNREILYETIRNLFFHVPMWFAMTLLFLFSMIASIFYMRTLNPRYDLFASSLAHVGLLLGVLATLTGMLWAQYAWGRAWSGDVKQNMAAISLLIYFAYFILRNSLEEDQIRARASSVYNIFAFISVIVLLFAVPRFQDSLHPGSGGNPGFGTYDLDGLMRLVFYPAVIGWTLIAVWIASIRYRMTIINRKIDQF